MVVRLIEVAILFSIMTRFSIEHMFPITFLASWPLNDSKVGLLRFLLSDRDTDRVDLDFSQIQISCLMRPHFGSPDRGSCPHPGGSGT